MEKVPQNHRHTSFANNLRGSSISRLTRIRSDKDGFVVLSPAIIVHYVIVEKFSDLYAVSNQCFVTQWQKQALFERK